MFIADTSRELIVTGLRVQQRRLTTVNTPIGVRTYRVVLFHQVNKAVNGHVWINIVTVALSVVGGEVTHLQTVVLFYGECSGC